MVFPTQLVDVSCYFEVCILFLPRCRDERKPLPCASPDPVDPALTGDTSQSARWLAIAFAADMALLSLRAPSTAAPLPLTDSVRPSAATEEEEQD